MKKLFYRIASFSGSSPLPKPSRPNIYTKGKLRKELIAEEEESAVVHSLKLGFAINEKAMAYKCQFHQH